MLVAAVESIEDHGYLMDIGVPGTSGFLSFDSLGPVGNEKENALNRMYPGSVKMVVVKGKSDNGRICHLDHSGKVLEETSVRGHLQKSVSSQPLQLQSSASVESMTPGSLVRGVVISVSSSGIILQIAGSFDSTADIFHSQSPEGREIRSGDKVYLITFNHFLSHSLGRLWPASCINYRPQIPRDLWSLFCRNFCPYQSTIAS